MIGGMGSLSLIKLTGFEFRALKSFKDLIEFDFDNCPSPSPNPMGSYCDETGISYRYTS